MRGYERDEYEELDEYEEDGEEELEDEEGEDGYREEETYEPTPEQLAYLQLRQRLKESIRKQRGTANAGSSDKINASRKDNYGSFFGPSQPVIAQRVIEESKALLENPNLAARISKPAHTSSKSPVSAPAGAKVREGHMPKVANGMKKKVEILKNTRDYSFLLSEDADVPAPVKGPPVRNSTAPKSEVRSTQPPPVGKHGVNGRGREVLNGRDERKQIPSNNQSRPKSGSGKTVPPKLPGDPRRQLGSSNGIGPGRPTGHSGMPPKTPLPGIPKKAPMQLVKNSAAGVNKSTHFQQSSARRQNTSHSQASLHRQTPSNLGPPGTKKSSAQRKEQQETSKPMILPKQAVSSSRDTVKPMQKRPSVSNRLPDSRPKPKHPKRPFDDDSDEDDPMMMLRRLTGYDPSRFRDAYDDDRDMEANFDDILKEERRSAKIARKEDEEQARLIEEEERRERARLAKKRKMSQK